MVFIRLCRALMVALQGFMGPLQRLIKLYTVCSFQYSGVFAGFLLVFLSVFCLFAACLLLVCFCLVLLGFAWCCLVFFVFASFC